MTVCHKEPRGRQTVDDSARRAPGRPGPWERHFGVFACVVVLVSILVRSFDFSVLPPAYHGIFITRPFCGLHDWAAANRAWAARNHIKYGLGYTRGYRTLAVGDPPTAHPLRYVSHPPLEYCILALGMLLFGTEDWSVRLFDVMQSALILLLVLHFLRKLYGSACALLASLVLVMLPLSAYFGFEPLTTVLALWALDRYLSLMRRTARAPRDRRRRLHELSVALFLVVQMSWAGAFYPVAIGLHGVAARLAGRKVQSVLAVVLLTFLSSLTLSLVVMAWGYRSNVEAETRMQAGEEPGHNAIAVALGRMKALYQWRARTGERDSFSWTDWGVQNMRFAVANFTGPGLLFLVGYLLYLLLVVPDPTILGPPPTANPTGPLKVPRAFTHMWFFLVPGLLFLFTFKGLFWRHQYWQSPFALFMALGAAFGMLLLGDLFSRIHHRLGLPVVATSILVMAVFCNRGLVSYRDERWHSLRTISLFKHLNRRIPPDKALLTFRDFVVRQSGAKTPFYRPEYAWYLDREMIVANAWQDDAQWVTSIRIDEIVRETLDRIRQEARTGRFPYYFVPARENPHHDSAYIQISGARVSAASLTTEELDRLLNNHRTGEDYLLSWEKHRRYREALIAALRERYDYEYYDNRARPGEKDFCLQGNTPCYLFDLTGRDGEPP